MGEKKLRNKNLTVPNFISFVRILIVPFFAYYFINDEIIISIVLLLASGLSDAVDGFIARKFNQITELGKLLDPFADKLTQVAVGVCLGFKFPILFPFFVVFFIKEIGMLVLASSLIKSNKKPSASKWFGKVATVLFYLSVTLIVVLANTNVSQSTFLIWSIVSLTCTSIMMIYATFKYFAVYKEILNSDEKKYAIDIRQEVKAKKNI